MPLLNIRKDITGATAKTLASFMSLFQTLPFLTWVRAYKSHSLGPTDLRVLFDSFNEDLIACAGEGLCDKSCVVPVEQRISEAQAHAEALAAAFQAYVASLTPEAKAALLKLFADVQALLVSLQSRVSPEMQAVLADIRAIVRQVIDSAESAPVVSGATQATGGAKASNVTQVAGGTVTQAATVPQVTQASGGTVTQPTTLPKKLNGTSPIVVSNPA